MALFCTQCGTSNADENAFCDHCGKPLRKPAATQAPGAAPSPTHSAAASGPGARKAVYVVAALGGLLLLGGAALYFALATPAPTSARLLAAAKAGYGEVLTQRSRQELCLSNMNYSANPFNVAQYDQRTQNWLNTLVSAGLYSPGVAVVGSGFLAQTVVQYTATPELAQWREGRSLCLSKGVEIADVVDIGKPTEQKLGQRRDGDASAPAVQTVSAQLVLQAVNVAPWLDKGEVQSTVLEQISGWHYQGGKLQKQTADVFGLRDGQWATGPTYKAELEKQYATARRTARNLGQSASTSAVGGGIFSSLGQLFSFGGHPLVGTWRMDTADMGGFASDAIKLGGLDMRLKFTRDSMETEGSVTPCTFEVDGERVKVTPVGQNTSQIFKMRDKDTAVVDMGFMQVSYKRVP